MCPRAVNRVFPIALEPDFVAIQNALIKVAPFLTIELDGRKWRPPEGLKVGEMFDDPFLAFVAALASFSVSSRTRPYSQNTRSKSVRRAIEAFGELRDALASLDYETRRQLTTSSAMLTDENRGRLQEIGSRLDYHDFTQRYWRECHAWIEGLGHVLANLPKADRAVNSKRPRDALIKHLHGLFAAHGRKRKGVQGSEQERRFINAVLEAMGAKAVRDPARRVKVLKPKPAA